MGAMLKFLMLLRTPSPLLIRNRSPPLRLVRYYLACTSSAQYHKLPSNSKHLIGFSYEQLHTQSARVARDDFYGNSSSGASTNSCWESNSWPEWSNMIKNLRFGGYFDRQSSLMHLDDAFTTVEHMPEEFVRAVSACLSFARDHPNLLWSLSRKDIEVVVKNGSSSLFKNSGDSVMRMESFLGFYERKELEFERANTVDMMHFLLSYACDPVAAADRNTINDREHVEVSVRNLLAELANASRTVRAFDISGSMSKQLADGYGQTARPIRQNMEMKRGDWICSKCNFMNFARNLKCLECDEARPKGQLTDGEWECPQCNFFNYRRNVVCLRCDCKRLVDASFEISRPAFGASYSNGRNVNDVDIKSRLAANEEKAERWFSKVSQLDTGSDLSSAIADEDFPEIMPLRKGTNRFVVSTRKTPLERRLANAQYRRNLGNDGIPEGNDIPVSDWEGAAETSKASISQRLDRILGRPSAVPGTDKHLIRAKENTVGENKGSSSSYAPFVPLHTDNFAESQKSRIEENLVPHKFNSVSDKVNELTGYSDSKNSESSKSDEDFPDIMPMRKGENRFLVNKKDRSLTPPLHKRRIATEQTNNTNFVPFVPFPPDYFAKKDKEPETGTSMDNSKDGPSAAYAAPEVQHVPVRLEDQNARVFECGADWKSAQWVVNQQCRRESWDSGFPAKGMEERNVDSVFGGTTGNSNLKPDNLQSNTRQSWNSGSSYSGYSQEKSGLINLAGNAGQQPENSQYNNESWKMGYTGKSLEGSAVKVLDPLDMSEEAKAERWFRRVAQIKDISELSNIPDEDFPEIMPMRKGVNRFVVSKRKTPLERRLTSPQYRRNLPIVNHDPTKNENDTS